MKKFIKKLALMVVALLTFSVGSNYTVKEVKAAGTFSQASSLSAGDTIIFACKPNNVVAGELSTTSTKYLLKVAATFNGTTVSTEGLKVKEYVVETNSSGQFAFKSGNQYLSWSSGNSAAFSSSVYYWKVAFAANGNATVDSVKTPGRKLKYNASSPRFACYTSTQTAIQIYKLGAEVEITDETKVQSAAESLAINSEFMYNTVLPTTGANDTSISWSSNNTAITVANNGVATVTRSESDIAVTLTAKITLNTTSITKDFSVIVKGIDENEPTINTKYKMMLTQESLGKDLYFAGAMNGYYFATTESYDAATNVILENAPYDGYYISMTNSAGAKKYINITVSGTYNNVTMDDVALCAWSYNAEYDTLITKVNGTSLFLGTYNTFNTISASNISFLGNKTNFPIHLVKADATVEEQISAIETMTQLDFSYNYTEGNSFVATAAYSGGETLNMVDKSNNASVLGLNEEEWSVIAEKGSASNMPGLNKDGDFRLYYNAGGSNTITFTNSKEIITSIFITFTSASYSNASVTVDGNLISGANGEYEINSNSFVIGNANTSNVQVRIKSIEIRIGTPNTYDSFGKVNLRYSATFSSDLFENVDSFGFNIAVGSNNMDYLVEKTTVKENNTTFSLVLTNITDYKTVITVTGYVIVDGERINLSSKSHSVESMIQHYLDNASDLKLSSTQIEVLKAFQADIA